MGTGGARCAGPCSHDIRVNGHTHLKGPAIASKATETWRNFFETQTLTHEDVVNRDVASGKSWSVSVNISAGTSSAGAMAGSSEGFARMDTNETFTTKSSIASPVNLTRPDLQAGKAAAMKAAERDPLTGTRDQKQNQLNELLWNEPPSCDGCAYNGGPTTPVSEVAGAKVGGILQTDKAAPPGEGTDSNYQWMAWYRAVQALQNEINGLNTRISAVDAKVYQTTLTTSPSGLHQPLLHTFDKAKATQELKDGVAVTAAFGKEAFKTAGTYSKIQYEKIVKDQCGNEPKGCVAAEKWDDGGLYKTLLHGLVGAISGGTNGAVAAMTAEGATTPLDALLRQAGYAPGSTTYDLLMAGGKAMVAAGAGGAQAAGIALTADANNRQLHPNVRTFVENPDRIRRYQSERGISYEQAANELARAAAMLNGEDWARIWGDSVVESARKFLFKESFGLSLPDGSRYFAPSEQDFKDAKKFVVEALEGRGYDFYKQQLAYNPDLLQKLKGSGAGIIDGALKWAKDTWNGIVDMPANALALIDALERAKVDPAAAAAALKIAVEKMGPELKKAALTDVSMAQLLTLQGDYQGASAIATMATLTVFDPTGKVLKGAKLTGKMATYLELALEHSAALKKLENAVGTVTEMPILSAAVRNNGMQAEAVAAALSKQMGVEVKVLQNASGHGVDLYAFDAVNNRYIVIEVKSSAVGSFGAPPAGGPEAFLKDRAAKAVDGKGFWREANVPKDVQAAATDITTNFLNNSPTVVGYKFEIVIPKPGQSGIPTVTIKKWGP